MTTTGELLVTLSGLPTGTAMEHLLAITGGGGPGGTTIIDAYTAELEGDVEVLLADDSITVVVDEDFSGDVSETNYDAEVSGDIDVDLECN